jgi:hypothetical protein
MVRALGSSLRTLAGAAGGRVGDGGQHGSSPRVGCWPEGLWRPRHAAAVAGGVRHTCSEEREEIPHHWHKTSPEFGAGQGS